MMKEQNILLNALLERYENSKTFTGNNKVSQNIYIKPEKIFPEYADDSKYEVFNKVNTAVSELEKLELTKAKRLKNGVVQKLILNLDKLQEAYKTCGRTSKKDIHKQLLLMWEQLAGELKEDAAFSQMFSSYVKDQTERISQNKQVAYFDGSFTSYQELLRAIREIVNNETEQFIRDFSVKLFGDSKKLELHEDKIRSFLYEYGDGIDREGAIEEYGIVKTPTYVSMKGEAILQLGDQRLDLSKLRGDISLSTISLEQIEHIDITGRKVVTIENLTSFHTFMSRDCFIIYLGGYHNNAKRLFLKKIYECNPDIEYFHFGDVDAGGFYIYEHLLRKTAIPFKLLGMDVKTLSDHRDAWRELTMGDRKRIKSIAEKHSSEGYREVLDFMLKNNCKLEQEAVNIEI
jgi:hypothetical protein